MNKLGIRNQIKGLLNRNDCTDAQADIFIDQAVARIQRTLRIPPMEKTQLYTAQSTGANLLALPNDFLQLKHLYHSKGTVKYVELSRYLETIDAPGYAPAIYTRSGGGLLIKPTPPEDFVTTLVYYGEIPDLVNDTDENFLTVIAPDLLVYAALIYAADFFLDDRRDKFEQIATTMYEELNAQAIEMEFAQEGMAVAPSAHNPEY